MEIQGTDRGSRITPRLINTDAIREIKEYHPEREAKDYWSVICFMDGTETVVSLSVQAIERALFDAEETVTKVSIKG